MPDSEGLSHGDIHRLALEQHMRAINDTDESGFPKEGLEHHPDVAQVAGMMAVAEVQSFRPIELFGDDDTELFRLAQLHGGVFNYD